MTIYDALGQPAQNTKANTPKPPEAVEVEITPDQKACFNCRFGREPSDEGQKSLPVVSCHRYPPQSLLVPAQGGAVVQPMFPLMRNDDDCGEFRFEEGTESESC